MHRWIFVVLSLSLACSTKEAPPEVESKTPHSEPESAEEDHPPQPAEQPSSVTAAVGLSVGDPPAVELLDPGEKPFRELGWTIKPSLEQQLVVKTIAATEGVLGGYFAVQGYHPNMTYTITFESPKRIVPGEAFEVAFRINKASADLSEAPKELRTKTRKAAQMLRGASGSYSFEPRGLVEDIKIALPANAPREAVDMVRTLEWSLSHMIVPFPKAPVGEGAKWTVARVVEEDGIRINELSTAKLVKLREYGVDLEIAIEQHAGRQGVAASNDSSKEMYVLLGQTSKGSVEATWELTEIVPRSASVLDEMEKEVLQKVDGRQVQSSGSTKKTVTIGRK